MNQKIIFGAGYSGNEAFEKLGAENVYAFADNNLEKIGTMLHGKRIISFNDMVELKNDYEILAASTDIFGMGKQLSAAGIMNFSIWTNGKEKMVCADKKAYTKFIQVRIVDHCNLNCKNCGSVCNKNVEPWYIDKDEYKRDLVRLRDLFYHIGRIKLLGGEPLLHPQLDEIIDITREVFGDSEIEIATNGILVNKLQQKILDSMAKNNAIVHISEYETTSKMMNRIQEVLNENHIRWYSHKCDVFFKSLTDCADKDAQKAFELCEVQRECMNLKRGRLYRCSKAEGIEKIEKQFQLHFELIENYDWVDIYRSDLDIVRLMDLFRKPGFMCKYCVDKPRRTFPWKPADGVIELSDYIITKEEYKNM